MVCGVDCMVVFWFDFGFMFVGFGCLRKLEFCGLRGGLLLVFWVSGWACGVTGFCVCGCCDCWICGFGLVISGCSLRLFGGLEGFGFLAMVWAFWISFGDFD